MLRLSGWQPYSIKIGDTWVSYRGFEPLSSWFRTAGDLAEANIEDGNYIEWGTTFGISYFKEFAENQKYQDLLQVWQLVLPFRL